MKRRSALLSPDVIWFRSLWYGGSHVCLWWAVLPSGTIHIASELVKGKCLISELSREIRQRTRLLGVCESEEHESLPWIRYTAAWKPAMEGKSASGSDGETRLDTFRNNGIVIRESSHDEAQGWTRVSELLGALPDGRPMLTIDPKCVQLVRALTNAVSDPNDPELLMESANDQPLRALRIGAMSRPAPRPFAPPPIPVKAVGHDLEALRNTSEDTGPLEWG